jgi:regulator of protease activity HflC (stomatin/prohibitin superfamily)
MAPNPNSAPSQLQREIIARPVSGYIMLVVVLVVGAFSLFSFIGGAPAIGVPGIILTVFLAVGLFLVNPNEAKVLQLFGKYVGTAKEPGLRWANPLYQKRKVSLRVRNFESGKLKVNDSSGSPIEIATIVVWRVIDTAEAVFEVDDYEEFVTIQSESALRNLATTYPYEGSEADGELSLRSDPLQIAEALKGEIQARLEQAGVEVIEARISHLAYAPEIAGAMLRRQQASAIIAAREQIVAGAVGMVEMALSQLERDEIVALDDERKASMVSNLLVVLCSDQETQPIVNTGTLYS